MSPQHHRNTRHPRETFVSQYIREIVYGGSDGIVTTFAVIAGFTGANMVQNVEIITSSIVILFAFANLCADAVSMGLGDYLSMKAESDMYQSLRTYERDQLDQSPSLHSETFSILEQRGFQDSDSKTLMEIFNRNHDFWVDWLMHTKHRLPDPGSTNPLKAALATFGSFLTFGIIPVIPFLILPVDTWNAFIISLISMIVALTLLGLLRWSTVGQGLRRSLFETLFVGCLSAMVAFFVGRVIQGA